MVDPSPDKRITRTASIFPVLVIFRILNALFTRSYFQADEFWQSLEPAHFKAFGYGELTWEWKVGLRSYAFPLLFEITYRIAGGLTQLFNLLITLVCQFGAEILALLFPNSDLASDISHDLYMIPAEYAAEFEYYSVLYGPKILMAILAATGEYFTIKLIQKLYIKLFYKKDTEEEGKPDISAVTNIAAQLTLMNFFNFFFITRTFINSFEMVLTAIALYYWDWSGGQDILTLSFSKSLFFAIFACFSRPSNAAIWLILGTFLLYNLVRGSKYKLILALILKISSIFTLVLTINAAIDYYFYGEIIFPVFRFVKFNFTSVLSEFYGTAPWHFHIAQSVPILLGYTLPIFIYSLIAVHSNRTTPGIYVNPFTQIKVVIMANIILYSSLKHKEFRFIYPLQPLFCVLSSFGLLKLKMKFKDYRALKKLLGFLPVVAIVAAAIINFFNESGVVEVMKFLHDENQLESIGFIMPCHSTPWQSHLHRKDVNNLWAVTCEPPLHLLDDPEAARKLKSYMDESDYLYANIPGFITKNFPSLTESKETDESTSDIPEFPHHWPQYLVLFEHLDDKFIRDYLKNTDYIEYKRFFNSLSHWDSRRAGDVIVYRKFNNRMELERKIIEREESMG
ncbi:GPI mannosyltransferase 3 [Nakaseomyces bracarensis]|uniref:Mannosyltransferase n=2 Tax=Nakaseomyces bracarensis TaxID=273131 RepID=A0ABR4NZS1_9SACH